MKSVGIVCEYNPFHNGHKRQIDLLRENGAETIICAMSGNFTQRGELAILDKYSRAEMATRCGADVVVEIPFPYSSFSAEGFAAAGVHILASLGVDTLSFGSECGSHELLARAADIVMSDDFISQYRNAEESFGSARGYFDTLSKLMGDKTALSPNDILGISYLCAIKKQGLGISAFPIKRKGAQYNESSLSSDKLPSAAAIRNAIGSSSVADSSFLTEYMPYNAFEVFAEAEAQMLAPVFTEKVGREILSFFKLMTSEDIIARAIDISQGGDGVADDGDGIVERLCKVASATADFNVFLEKAYNSRYPNARINRVILFSLFGVSDSFLKTLPDFSLLLAASDRGRELLSSIRKKQEFPIITKPADAPDGSPLTRISRLADELYSLAMPSQQADGFFIKKRPFML